MAISERFCWLLEVEMGELPRGKGRKSEGRKEGRKEVGVTKRKGRGGVVICSTIGYIITHVLERFCSPRSPGPWNTCSSSLSVLRPNGCNQQSSIFSYFTRADSISRTISQHPFTLHQDGAAESLQCYVAERPALLKSCVSADRNDLQQLTRSRWQGHTVDLL